MMVFFNQCCRSLCRRTSSPPFAGQALPPSHTSSSGLLGCTGNSWRRGTWSLPSHSVSACDRGHGEKLNPPKKDPQFFDFLSSCVVGSLGQVDNSQTVHMRVLQTIYKRLICSRLDCPRYGAHWENIGFQGKTPALSHPDALH